MATRRRKPRVAHPRVEGRTRKVDLAALLAPQARAGAAPGLVWLASYPRSGNTLLRTVLHQCFGLRSASLYRNDLGGNRELEEVVGHVKQEPDGTVRFPASPLTLVKTHEPPGAGGGARTIYVVRDGRAACVSLWRFVDDSVPLERVILGHHRFGTWSGHIAAWRPWERPDTLLLKFEDLTGDFSATLERIGGFLRRKILRREIPRRRDIASMDGRWVRTRSDWREHMSPADRALFDQVNGETMRRIGYSAMESNDE